MGQPDPTGIPGVPPAPPAAPEPPAPPTMTAQTPPASAEGPAPTADSVITRLETIATWHSGRQAAFVQALVADVKDLLG